MGISPEGGTPSLSLFDGRQDPFGYGGQDPDLRGESPLGMEQVLGHRLASITMPLGDVTSWAFDDQGRTTRIDYPWVEAETFTYGPDGEVDTQTLADGTVLTFTHDAAMRETARTSTTGHDRSTVYGPEGRVASVTGPTGTVRYGYDPAGRMTSIDTPAGGRLGPDGGGIGPTLSFGKVEAKDRRIGPRVCSGSVNGERRFGAALD